MAKVRKREDAKAAETGRAGKAKGAARKSKAQKEKAVSSSKASKKQVSKPKSTRRVKKSAEKLDIDRFIPPWIQPFKQHIHHVTIGQKNTFEVDWFLFYSLANVLPQYANSKYRIGGGRMHINRKLPFTANTFNHMKSLLEDVTFLPCFSSELYLSQIKPVNRKIMEFILTFIESLNIRSYRFHSVEIDDQFMKDFARTQLSPLELLRFDRCALDKAWNAEDKTRFSSFIIAARPAKLVLHFPRKDESEIFDLTFIEKYATCTSNPELILKHGKVPPISATRASLPAFSSFKNLVCSSLTVEPQFLLDSIKERLESKNLSAREKCGKWSISLTAPITIQMVDQFIDNCTLSRHQQAGRPDSQSIRSEDIAVSIKCKTRREVLRVAVTFRRYSRPAPPVTFPFILPPLPPAVLPPLRIQIQSSSPSSTALTANDQ